MCELTHRCRESFFDFATMTHYKSCFIFGEFVFFFRVLISILMIVSMGSASFAAHNDHCLENKTSEFCSFSENSHNDSSDHQSTGQTHCHLHCTHHALDSQTSKVDFTSIDTPITTYSQYLFFINSPSIEGPFRPPLI